MGRPVHLPLALAIATAFAITVTTYLVWAATYVGVGSTTLFIDRFGGQFVKLVLWTVAVPLVAIGLHSRLRRNRGKPVLEVTAIAMMFAVTVSMYLVWAVAYVNGGSTTLFIDRFGEQFLELLMWSVVISLVAIGLDSYLRRIRDDRRAAEPTGSTIDGDR